MKHAIYYGRVSPRRNLEESESLDMQLEFCQKFASENDWEIELFFSDEKSGADINRPGLWNAIDALKRGSALIVYRFDRIARDGFITYDVWRRVLRKGACLISASGEGKIDDNLSPEEELKFGMIQLFASYERKVIAARTSAAMLRHQANGRRMSGPPPYGYAVEERVIETDKGPQTKGFLVKAPGEQAVIESVIQLHKSGLSYSQIVAKLAGAPNREHPFTVSTVRNILDRNLYPEKRAKRRKQRQRG